MANLIKRIAISTSRKTGQASMADEFKSSSNLSTTGNKSGRPGRLTRTSVHELSSMVSYNAESKATHDRVISFAPVGNQIKETREIIVSNEPNPFYDKTRRTSEVEVTGGKPQGYQVEGRELEPRRKSMESITEGNESLKSVEPPKRLEDSDDEAALVGQKFRAWGRRPS